MNYHDDYSAVSKTMLNLFCQSRQEYYLTYVTREMPPKAASKAMFAGQVLHAMLLEDRKFYEIVAQFPPDCLNVGGGKIAKRADAFEAEHPDLICMKPTECDEIRAVVNAVTANKTLADLINQATLREERFDALIEDVACKCKPDIVCELPEKVVCCDLKFTTQIHPQAWRRVSKNLRYWAQDAHYSAVLQANYKLPVEFRFCVIELAFPFRICWRSYDPQSRATAFAEHRKIIRDIRECHATGNWSDDWQNTMVLEPWDVSDDQLVEVE